MNVHFSPETESRLNEAAAGSGRPAEEYVRDLVERSLNEGAAFRQAVRQGFASLDRGAYIEEDEMDARVEKMLRS